MDFNNQFNFIDQGFSPIPLTPKTTSTSNNINNSNNNNNNNNNNSYISSSSNNFNDINNVEITTTNANDNTNTNINTNFNTNSNSNINTDTNTDINTNTNINTNSNNNANVNINTKNINADINQQFSQHGLSVSQIQEIYKRLQQLKFQHGQAATRMPQYIKLYTLLSNDPNFQKIQHHLQQKSQLNRINQQTNQQMNPQINQQTNQQMDMNSLKQQQQQQQQQQQGEVSINNLNQLDINKMNQLNQFNTPNNTGNLSISNVENQSQNQQQSRELLLQQQRQIMLQQQLQTKLQNQNQNQNHIQTQNHTLDNTATSNIQLNNQQNLLNNRRLSSNTHLSAAGSPIAGSPGQSANQPSSIFHPIQAHILKFQIATFKKFIQNQQITPDLNKIINVSYEQFQKQRPQNSLLQNQTGNQTLQSTQLSPQQQHMQQQQQQQQQQHLQQQQQQQQQRQQQQPPLPHIPSLQSQQHPANDNLNSDLQNLYKQAEIQKQTQQTQTQVQLKQQPQDATAKKDKKKTQKRPRGRPVGSTSSAHATSTTTPIISSNNGISNPIKQNDLSINQIQELPPHPPMNLEKIDNEYQNLKKENIQNPLARVDSFIIPQIKSDILYEFFSMPKSKVFTPSVYPNPLDLETAIDLKNLHEMLLIQYELEDLEKLSEFDDSFKHEFEAFKLLPYQQSLRGYVLSSISHQNMLLINHLPNFSAKIRNICLEDASLVNELFLEQNNLKLEKEKHQVIERQTNLLNASNDHKKVLSDKKLRYQRLSKNLMNYHQQTEKEEQRRIERNAKQRLQALKANDEEAYVKLLDQTKDTRITHLLKQTNSFLSSLTDAVRDQQKETHEKMIKVGHTDENEKDTEIKNNEEIDEEEQLNLDYYHVAHRIKEKVEKQPSILVGGTLKEYQIRGLEWMVSLYNNHLNGILADEMGLGKTIQTISLLTYITEVKKLSGPFLVIVPLSTLPNWNNEFDKWAPSLKKISYKGTPQYRKELQQKIKNRDFNVLLTTYEYIIKDKYLLSKIKWVHMIIDEGHRMKNAKSKLSYTLNEFYHTDYRLILTGTPLQNNLPELWALLNFVLPKIFNSVKSFDEWFNTPFANTGGQDKIELSEEETLLVIRRLHKVLRPFLLRRLKKDVEKSLPNKIENVIKCKKSGLQSKMYHQMLKYNKLFVGDKENKAVGIKGMNNKLMQLRKICNHPFVFQAIEDMINPSHQNNDLIWRTSGKFELLDRILPKFKATGHRVLMFFQMTQIMDIMEDFLRYRDIKYMRLDGDTKADDRTTLLKDFNAENSPYFVFLLSTRAGGLGLNLQTADTVIIFDTDWNPHQDLQAQDRAHRIGQKNEVRILRLITSDSIEEYILEKAHQKLDIDGKVIQAGKFDQKSTNEEQEALLRKLIESEEQADDNEEDLNDDELNELLARNEDEFKTFREMDDAREKNWNSNLPRLFSEEELPAVYHQEPEEEEEEPDIMENYGRGTRERKITKYDENLTEEQWLKQIDGLVSDDDEVSEDEIGANDETNDSSTGNAGRKAKSKKFKKKKSKQEVSNTVNDGSSDGNTLKDEFIDIKTEKGSENNTDEGHDSKRAKIGSKNPSKKVTKKSVLTSINDIGDGYSAGPPVRRRKNFGTLPLSRDIYPSEEPIGEDRGILQRRMLEILNCIQTYDNPAGRRLCKIFNAKPQKKFYPDYYVIIKNPIAFDTVKRRINNWTYNTLEEFMFDVHLIFKNARLYNLDTSVLYSDSMILEGQALKIYVGYLHQNIDFTEFDKTFGLLKPNGDKIPDPIVKWDEEKQEAVIIDDEDEDEKPSTAEKNKNVDEEIKENHNNGEDTDEGKTEKEEDTMDIDS